MTDQNHNMPNLAAVDAEIKGYQEQLAVLVYEEEKLIARRLHLMNKLRLCIEIMRHHMPEGLSCPTGTFPELNGVER